MPPRPAAARGAAPSPPAGGPRSSSGNESGGKKKHKKKNKKKRRREGDNFTPSSHQHVGAQHAVSQRAASRDNPPSASGTAHSAKTTPSSKKNTRAKEIPARFTHPQLDSELRRLRRSWLSPGDPLFRPALDVSYRGMRHVPAPSLPPAIHKGFRESFDGLHEAGLFMYDTVQAGGKRLSKTFVTRTLLGDPGITYKYLGLRLFAHPWDRGGGDFRKGPGDGLADALNDRCLSDLFRGDAGAGGVQGNSPDGGGASKAVAGTLRKVGDLSEWMRLRALALEKEASEGGGGGEQQPGGQGGSCSFNLTLINRMESSATKRDLKPDPLFAMGKCSVSWHADSCLQDFSTIGVYHCTDPVPAEPDWGIALRVSKEAEGGGGTSGGGSDGAAAGDGKTRRDEGGVSATSGQPAVGKGTATVVPEQQQEREVLTPPLLVPLQSGDAYFLLDDFNHFHEHAVVSGSSTLRYSSTHRVAATEGNTFSHVQKRCEEVLAGGAAAAEDHRILDLAQVRAEQALLTELESEWLNQFWVQGRRHAVLHPWWRGPMALVLATWRELERRTALTVQRLMSLRDDEGLGLGGARASASAASASAVAEPAAIARAFETVLRVLEERRESRSRWSSRFADPAYRSLPADCSPVVPALWPADGGGRGSGGVDGAGSPLPQSLAGVISRLRECYTAVYRTASGGKKAGSAKAIAAGAASNWELFRAGSSSPSAPSGAKLNGGGGGRAGGEDGKKSGGARGGRTAGRGPKRKRPNKKQERGSK